MNYRRIRFGKLGNSVAIGFAVEELAKYLKKMDTELDVDILQVSNVNDCFTKIIWVGRDINLEPFVPEVAEPTIDDAISVSVTNNSGYITGSNDRSVLIAVYRFLRELGCEWVRPGLQGERIPEKKIESVSVQIYETASYRHRGVCIEGATSYDNVLDMLDFLPKVGLNSYFFEHMEPVIFFRRWYNHKSNPYLAAEPVSKAEVLAMLKALEAEMLHRGICYHKTGHGWTSEPLGLDGTSWGALAAGQVISEEVRSCLAQINGRRELWGNVPLNTNLCYSQSKVRKLMTDAVVDYCKGNPNVDVLHFWLSDGLNNHCECEECSKLRPSDWYVMLLNELDAAMSEAGLDTKVVFLIYVDLLWEPQEIHIKNPDRFILMFAPITRNYGENYADHLVYEGKLPEFKCNHLNFASSLELNLEQLRQWQKYFNGDSFIYDYHLMYAHFNDPGYEACARNVFEDMRSLEQIGLNGMISCQLQRCFFPTALPMQMMAAALWNKNCDYEEKADRYYMAAFGPDGHLVREYMKQISDMFAIYTGPSHGLGAKIDGDLVTDYIQLTKCIEDFRPIIAGKCQEGTPWCEDWKHLAIHSQYVLALADALCLTQIGKHSEAKAAIAQMLDIVNRNELALQKVMDGNKAKMHFERRLDPEKCRSVDVM